jgi:hypothetical protein
MIFFMQSGARVARSFYFAFLIALAAISVQVSLQDSRYPFSDEFRYLSTAAHIESFSVFSSGNPTRGPASPSMTEAPMTPIILAGLFKLDESLNETVQCILRFKSKNQGEIELCSKDYGIFILFQTLLMAFSASLIWLIARQCGASPWMCWAAMGLALISEQYGYFVRFFLTEIPLLLFLSIFFWGLATALGPRGGRNSAVIGFAVAGAALGLCSLTREGYVVLAYVVPLVMLLGHLIVRRNEESAWRRFCRGARLASLFVIAYALILSPWLLRNWLTFDSLEIVDGHGNSVIVERVAYNMMTWREWAAAWFFWLPDFGDKLGPALFGDDAVERLRWYGEGSFYQIGNGEFQTRIDREMGQTSDSRLIYVIENYIYADLFKHISVSFVMCWRGLWIGKYFGLVAQILSAAGAIVAIKRGRLDVVVALMLPALFMVGLHGFVSVSIPRYNLAMLPYLSIMPIFALAAAWQWLDSRKRPFLYVPRLRPWRQGGGRRSDDR